jgi:negative regulator of replication initiation
MAKEKTTTASTDAQKSPAERTKTVLVPRVNTVLDSIRVMTNCANPDAYALSKDAVTKIFARIEADIAASKKRFLDAADGKKTAQVKTGFDL